MKEHLYPEETEDEFGHIWTLGWEDSDTPHPQWRTMGAHVGECSKCGMYQYEFSNQICGPKIREWSVELQKVIKL